MIWDERPQNLTGDELIAWALTAIAETLQTGLHEIAEEIDLISDSETSISLDKIAQTISEAGWTDTLTSEPGLQYVGGALHRIAEELKETRLAHAFDEP